jgi:Putative Flp pilus-assembly TadE/G-like
MTRARTGIDLSSERGAALLITAVALASLILVASLVVDVANWYVHKRHLQTQADAAAFAGGSAFKLPGCNNTEIYKAAQQYSGVKSTTLAIASPYNLQVGRTPDAKVHMLVNSPDPDGYWSNGYTANGTPEPCEAKMIDIKMTESSLPWYLGGSLVPAINAHARVSFRLVDHLKGQLPIGVVDVNPHSGAVIFYDEANPGTLSTTYAKYLRKVGTANGLNEWANVDSSGTAVPVSVPMPASGRLGSVVAFSSDGPPSSSAMSITGTVTEICARARVDCYNDPASGGGLLFAHGYPSGAAGNKTPVIKGATLSTANCSGSYAYFTYNDAACTATLSVTFDTTISSTNWNRVELTATPGGNCSGGGHDASNSLTRTFTINIPAHAGPCPITVTWIVKQETNFPSAPSPPGIACGNAFNNNNPCNGSFGMVQRAVGGDDDLTGPVRTAHLLNMGSAFGTPSCPGPLGYGPACNSWPIGESHSLAVDVQLVGAITTSQADPPVLLRIVGGSRNGTIDCNRTGNLRDQLANGCDLPYRINTNSDLRCVDATTVTTKTALLASPQAYPCVAVQTGGSIGQFSQGIQDRILNGSSQCPAAGAPGRNYWGLYPDFPTASNPLHPFNDPRVVYVFMVPFGSFRGSGNVILPIVSFGVFYVRGWGGNGNGNNDPCTSDPGYVGNVPSGDLAGNFITHVGNSADASGTEACVVGSFNPCVAVLTK